MTEKQMCYKDMERLLVMAQEKEPQLSDYQILYRCIKVLTTRLEQTGDKLLVENFKKIFRR